MNTKEGDDDNSLFFKLRSVALLGPQLIIQYRLIKVEQKNDIAVTKGWLRIDLT